MATAATKAQGTLLKIGNSTDGASNSYTTIAEVLDIKGPKLSQQAIEVTNQSSTSGYREYVGGLLEGGQTTLTVNFLPTDSTQNHTAGLVHDLENRVRRDFELVFTDSGSTTWKLTALVIDFEPDAKVSGALQASVTLQASGAPTLAG